MKYKILATLIALGGLTAPGTASAACPDGEFSWFTRTGTGDEADPYVAHENCAKTATTGSPAATTGGIMSIPLLDGEGNQVVVDGHPISVDAIHQPLGFSKVYGFNGTAMGNGATVGSASCAAGWTMNADGLGCSPTDAEAAGHYHHGSDAIPEVLDENGDVVTPGIPAVAPTCDDGWSPSNGTCAPTGATTTAAFSQKSVNGGTALGAGTSVQGHGGTAVGFGASVGEGHEGSTAIGANAKTTKARQVMIGTKDDTVTAPGVAKGMEPGSNALVTTDSEGNLGNDGGATARTLNDHEGRISSGEQKNSEQDGRLDGHDQTLASHGKTLDSHGERITATEQKNSEQDGRLDGHGKRITTVEGRADATDNRLNNFRDSGGSLENWAGSVDGGLADHSAQIDSLNIWRGVSENRITALEGVTVLHGAQIAQLQKDVKRLQGGIALATAITVPHVDIDKKLALTISGAGYDGQGAIAAAAALRISDHVQGFVGGGVAFEGGPAAVKGGLTFQW